MLCVKYSRWLGRAWWLLLRICGCQDEIIYWTSELVLAFLDCWVFMGVSTLGWLLLYRWKSTWSMFDTSPLSFILSILSKVLSRVDMVSGNAVIIKVSLEICGTDAPCMVNDESFFDYNASWLIKKIFQSTFVPIFKWQQEKTDRSNEVSQFSVICTSSMTSSICVMSTRNEWSSFFHLSIENHLRIQGRKGIICLDWWKSRSI